MQVISEQLSDDVFIVKYKERSTGKIFEINPHKYILISGELPDKWK